MTSFSWLLPTDDGDDGDGLDDDFDKIDGTTVSTTASLGHILSLGTCIQSSVSYGVPMECSFDVRLQHLEFLVLVRHI